MIVMKDDEEVFGRYVYFLWGSHYASSLRS